MAGKGPPPKNPALRQRRNRATTAATLDPAGRRGPAPPLPKREKGAQPWHALVRAWWRDVWASPMAAKFLTADVHGLYLIAELRDRFWRGHTEVANEIRLEEARFGLSPVDRWRLQWEIHETPAPAPSEPAPTPPAANSGDRDEPDPRKVLSMVPRGRR